MWLYKILDYEMYYYQKEMALISSKRVENSSNGK